MAFKVPPKGPELRSTTITQKDLDRETIAALEKAGVPPPIVHAFKRTGWIVDRQGYERLSEVDRREWDAAIDEWYEAQGRTDEPK